MRAHASTLSRTTEEGQEVHVREPPGDWELWTRIVDQQNIKLHV